jgi:hypothetical protein
MELEAEPDMELVMETLVSEVMMVVSECETEVEVGGTVVDVLVQLKVVKEKEWCVVEELETSEDVVQGSELVIVVLT